MSLTASSMDHAFVSSVSASPCHSILSPSPPSASTESFAISDNAETLANTSPRRRAQNRASQRAFRERKARHVKSLELQIEKSEERQQDLTQLYMRSADEVSKLTSHIQVLKSDILELRSSSDLFFSNSVKPGNLDAIPASNPNYSGPGMYFDKSIADSNSGFGMSAFGDNF